MLRKVLTGAAAAALPLTGLALWGGSQLASAVAVAPLNCSVSGGVSFTPGSAYPGADPLPPGLTLAASGAMTVHTPGGASAGATEVEVTSPVVVSGGVTQAVSPAIPGQTFKIGRAVYTLTRVDNFIDGVHGLELNPGKTILSFVPSLAAPLAANAAVAIAATTTGASTVAYVANSVATNISLSASGCSSDQGDFYPTSASLSINPTNGTDAATSLEAKSAAIAGSVTWPATSGGYTNGGVSDTVSFAAGAGAFCAGGGFSVLNGTQAVANGTAGSVPCTQGEYYYNRGRATGTYATTVGNAQLGLNGIIACTETELTTAGDYPTKCDGEAGATDGVTTPTAAGLEFQNAEIYGESNGDCLSGGNGWSAGDCSPPLGGDGSPLVEIIGLTLAGASAL